MESRPARDEVFSRITTVPFSCMPHLLFSEMSEMSYCTFMPCFFLLSSCQVAAAVHHNHTARTLS